MNLDQLLSSLRQNKSFMDCVTHWRTLPATDGSYADFPASMDQRIQKVLEKRGIFRLYSHQAEAFRLAEEKKDFVVVTPTASGKTLCYNLPVLSSILKNPDARALYLFPTKALSAPYTLDPTLCVCYSQYIRQAGKDETPIPMDIRPNMGCTVQGCDVCQNVCPLNKPRQQMDIPVDPYLAYLAQELSLTTLLHMPEGLYEHYVRPIMYNYFKDPKYFQRNAAIAMANTGDSAYVPELIAELSNPDEEIRAYVVWALGQLNTPEAKAALAQRQTVETSPWVREELAQALK